MNSSRVLSLQELQFGNLMNLSYVEETFGRTVLEAMARIKARNYNIQTMKHQLQTVFEGSGFEGFPYV